MHESRRHGAALEAKQREAVGPYGWSGLAHCCGCLIVEACVKVGETGGGVDGEVRLGDGVSSGLDAVISEGVKQAGGPQTQLVGNDFQVA